MLDFSKRSEPFFLRKPIRFFSFYRMLKHVHSIGCHFSGINYHRETQFLPFLGVFTTGGFPAMFLIILFLTTLKVRHCFCRLFRNLAIRSGREMVVVKDYLWCITHMPPLRWKDRTILQRKLDADLLCLPCFTCSVEITSSPTSLVDTR